MKSKFIISVFCLALLLVGGARLAKAGTDSGGGWTTVGSGQMWGTVGAPYGTASVSVGTQTLIPSGQAEALALLMGPSGVAPTLSLSATNTLTGAVGVVFSNQITATGTDPITFSGTGLPGGLAIATNGLITGTPTTAGTNTATLTASNAFGTTNQAATFVIARGTPEISNWPTAAPITYGQTLSNSVLSGGTGNVAGVFSWTVPGTQPNAGTSSFQVVFTPTATANYNSITSTVVLVVNQATPLLTWTPSPAVGLNYPAALGSAQLNATANVAGSFSYNPAGGAVLNAGTTTLVATFTPTDTANYRSGLTISNTVTVAAIVANDDSLTRDGLGGATTKIALSELVANDYYSTPTAPTVSLPSGATAQGGTVSIDNGWILYTSPSNLASSSTDSFTYRITDSLGNTATATVYLAAGDYSAVAVNIVWVKDANFPGTGKDVSFAVTPNRSYRIYATSSLVAPISWQDLGGGSVYSGGVSGSIILNDPGAGSQRFYKLEEYRQ